MDLVVNNNFNDLTYDELLDTDGGGWPAVALAVIIILFVVCSTKGCSDADRGK